MIVSLIGFRGAGKTTVGRLVATRLGAPFADADEAIAAAAGASIAEIFSREGEAGFRAREEAALATLLASAAGRSVVSLGGGAVLSSANRERMRAAGLVVYLEARPATLRERLAADPATAASRPALVRGSKDAVAEIDDLLAARRPLYESTAHERVVVDDRSPEAIADEIAMLVLARRVL